MKTLDISKIPSDFDKLKYVADSINNSSIEICFIYASDFRNSVILRSFVGIICDSLGIEGKWKSRLILIIDELNNNAVEYGSKSDEVNSMRFSIITDVNGDVNINVEVEDTGASNLSKKASEMVRLRENKGKGKKVRSNPIRGRGLFVIIEQLVDKLYFRDSKNGGLVVGVNKKIRF
ncbi:hypothetical protein CSA08_01780 [Candidatus Gracilibacteria bacterium]|nr:MAG: hypothetical protein CSA08_01780 [Candidatus Gracilibacteria bacterium]